ncbi:sulfite exporter TauE/SafE family protein [Prochlorococcus sp. MIT 1300]|uniref:sulfite exporter TauE/SafE family protein n=1 Tax=Prochlorococcus sp. MIT 1300 TaxID=3096218 RepID=UPI002A765B2A|nr:sulfite exporter TauE/SafE family protein [Prochlorococcus sp. MIT 1300]
MTQEDILFQLILWLISFIANMFSAFAGGGAGLIQLPALILLGLPFTIALGTHKLASVALGVGAGLRHMREGALDTRLTSIILFCGLPGVYFGSQLVVSVPEKLATYLLGLLTIWLALFSFKKKNLGTIDSRYKPNIKELIKGGLVLFLIGLLNGSLSSGTGLFVTIWLVYWFGLSYTKAIAYTLILVGLFWNGTGAIVLGMNSDIKLNWLPSLISGSLIGGYCGAHIGITKGNSIVKKAFESISFLMGVSLIIRNFF